MPAVLVLVPSTTTTNTGSSTTEGSKKQRSVMGSGDGYGGFAMATIRGRTSRRLRKTRGISGHGCKTYEGI